MTASRRTANIWLIVLILALFITLLSFTGILAIHAGGGILILGGTLTSIIAFVFRRKAVRQVRLWDRLTQGEIKPVASWLLDKEAWRAHVEAQFRETSDASSLILIVLVVLGVIIGFPVGLAVNNLPAVLACVAILFAVILPIARISPKRAREEMLHAEPRIQLADECIRLGNRLYPMKGHGHRCESIVYAEGSLRIVYTGWSGRNARQQHTLLIPVPAEAMPEIESILEHFTNLV